MPGDSRSLDEEREQVERERDEEPLRRRRTTEQGDELTKTHSLGQRHQHKLAYLPPRQPAQDPPARDQG